MPYDIFISYASANLPLAEHLHASLTDADFHVWFDRARLEPGCDWHREIEQHCEDSRIVIPVLTPNWGESDWTKFETYGAEAVIPLVCEGAWDEVSTPPLERHQAEKIDFTAPDNEAWERLFKAVRRLLARPRPEKVARLSHLRYRANDHFVGRERELLRLHEELHGDPRVVLTQGRVRALAAMGGAGKTTLARHYAEKFWRCYQDLFWVDCRNGLVAGFAEIHDLLYPDRMDIGLTEGDKALSAYNEMNGQDTRLLVLDNAEDEHSVMDWIPKTGGCHTLITSRFSNWSAAVQTIHLYVLDREPSLALLQSRSGRTAEGAEVEACGTLAEELGYLPLALEQAAAYIQQQGEGFGFTEYLRLYEQACMKLLSVGTLGSTEYPDPVATTWLPTIEKMPLGARTLLELASFFASTPIAVAMLVHGSDVLSRYLELRGVDDRPEPGPLFEFWVREQLAVLSAYSMIRLEGQAFTLHPLLQTVQYVNQPAEQCAGVWCAATDLLCGIAPPASWPEDKRNEWSLGDEARWAQIRTHAERLRIVADELPDKPFSPCLMMLLVNALATDSEYGAAIVGCDELLEALRDAGSQERAVYLDTLEARAYLKRQGGLTGEAHEGFTELHEMRRRSQGDNHRDTLRALHNVACVLNQQGHTEEALAIMEDVTERRLNLFGETDYDTVTGRHDIGWVHMTGPKDLDEAERLLTLAKENWRASFGMESPDARTAAENLAQLYGQRGDNEGAAEIQKELLEGTRIIKGDNHLDCYRLMHNLSKFTYSCGRNQEAFDMIAEVVEGYQRFLPPDHRDILTAVQDLGTMYGQLEQYDKAEVLLREAYEGYLRTQGESTPDALRTLRNLTVILEAAGRSEEARELHLRHLQLIEDNSDASPLELRQAAGTCVDLGEYGRGEAFLQRVLEHGFEVPGTHCHLARVCLLTDRDDKAARHVEEAWTHRGEANNAYVVARILWLRLLLALLDDPDPGRPETAMLLSGLKAELTGNVAFMVWGMSTVLEHLKPRLGDAAHDLLSAIVEGMGSAKGLESLGENEIWSRAEAGSAD